MFIFQHLLFRKSMWKIHGTDSVQTRKLHFMHSPRRDRKEMKNWTCRFCVFWSLSFIAPFADDNRHDATWVFLHLFLSSHVLHEMKKVRRRHARRTRTKNIRTEMNGGVLGSHERPVPFHQNLLFSRSLYFGLCVVYYIILYNCSQYVLSW
jgi:hypothetical protein